MTNRVSNLSKCYQIYNQPNDRLKQFIVPKLCRVFLPLRKRSPGPSLRSVNSTRDLSRSGLRTLSASRQTLKGFADVL